MSTWWDGRNVGLRTFSRILGMAYARPTRMGDGYEVVENGRPVLDSETPAREEHGSRAVHGLERIPRMRRAGLRFG